MIQFFEVTDLKKENPSDAEESGEKKNLLNTFMDIDFWYLCTCTWCHEWCRYAESVVDFMYNFGWLKADMGTIGFCMRQQMESLRLSGISGIYCSKKIQSE